MATKEHTVDQPLLLNRHLKEWTDNLASEQEAFYQLRGKHGIERDQFTFERSTDTSRQRKLSTQQANEMAQLKQQTNELRLSIVERHAKEKNTLNRKIE